MSSSCNVWTVLWQSPDGKPFTYKTAPATSAEKIRPRRFEVSEVQKYRDMVLRHLPGANFRCLSNVEIPGVEVVPIQDPELIAWWAKMELFRPGLPEGRNVYFDLDTLLLRGIKGIEKFEASFAVIPGMTPMEKRGSPRWEDQEGKWRYPRYQTSCIVWDTSEAPRIWNRFQEIKSYALDHYASDQDFIGNEFPNEATMPREWFSKLRNVRSSPRRTLRVCLTMMAHNDGAAQQYPWVNEYWPSQ